MCFGAFQGSRELWRMRSHLSALILMLYRVCFGAFQSCREHWKMRSHLAPFIWMLYKVSFGASQGCWSLEGWDLIFQCLFQCFIACVLVVFHQSRPLKSNQFNWNPLKSIKINENRFETINQLKINWNVFKSKYLECTHTRNILSMCQVKSIQINPNIWKPIEMHSNPFNQLNSIEMHWNQLKSIQIN